MIRGLPNGYSIRTVRSPYASPKLAPFWREQQLDAGQSPSIWGYAATIRKMRRICRLHARHNIDRTD